MPGTTSFTASIDCACRATRRAKVTQGHLRQTGLIPIGRQPAGAKVFPSISSGVVVTNTGPVFQVVNSVARTDTSNKIVTLLPANATLTDITLLTKAVSNAGTTATVSCGFTSGTPTEYVN